MESSIYDFSVLTNQNEALPLAEFEGKVLLIVNTASKCGFTPQYRGLQELYQKYHDRGLVILGFPCDQFGHQEPGTDDEIASFCSMNYGVTFPIMKKIDVNGAATHPLFRYLRDQAGGILGNQIKWNFTKFLVSADGRKVHRYAPTTTPASLEADLVALLPR